MAPYTREENERFAAAIATEDPDEAKSFFARLQKQIEAGGNSIPEVSVSFKDLKVVVDASDSAGVPCEPRGRAP
jgi:hypothetical protein